MGRWIARGMMAVLVSGVMTVAAGPVGAGLAVAPTKTNVVFKVTNPTKPFHAPFTVRGFLSRPAGCNNKGVVLAMHGLSYGAWAWDFPLRPATYSVADALASRGYALLAVDELGYGASAHPGGYGLTVEAYAAMTSQIIQQIRAGTYGGPAFSHVGLMGHSAGTEIVELTTELYPGLVDELIATGYTHEPFVNNNWLIREWSQDNLRAAQSDYEYFETNPTIRAHDMYDLANADADVVQLDNSMANLTPSGEVFSIGSQPSRLLLATIRKPVLVVLAAQDELFPGSYGKDEMLLFAHATDKTLHVIPNAGHAFMLQRNAAVGQTLIANWLDAHQGAVPRCV